MKKNYLKVVLLIMATALIGGCTLNNTENETGESSADNQIQDDGNKEIINIDTDEEAFNDSGRAKAIESETDFWQFYDNLEVGFSFNYPHDATLLENDNYSIEPNESYIKIDVRDIGLAEGPMDLSLDEAMENISSLSGGEFGINHDFPLEASKKVKSVGFLFAQDFMTLGRFEICDVTLERKLLFYFNNKQILISLIGPKYTLMNTMPEYFTTNKENCGNEKIWDMERQSEFYNTLVNKNGATEIQRWFDNFDKMAETIVFAQR